jgi:cytochrome c oxidase assembly protein subunit 15
VPSEGQSYDPCFSDTLIKKYPDIVGMIVLLFIKSRKFVLDKTQDNGVKTLLVFVFIQFLLGIFTLLFHVPLWLGLAHQIMAFFLLTAMTFTLHRFTK